VTEKRGLTRAQIQRLMRGIDPAHVDKKQGLTYMAQHEVRAELTRIFGVGNWDSQVESMDLLWEWEGPSADGKKTMYRACYKAAVRLTIRDYWGNVVCSFVEHHAEANSNLPDRGEAHAMAITSVESYALRRAAIGLGDRLGLGLYNGGATTPLVRGTLQLTDVDSPLYTAPTPPPEEGKVAPVTRLQSVTNDAR
jgi:hypothetical protein